MRFRLLLAAALLGAASHAAAQPGPAPYAGRRVGQVQVLVDGTPVSDPTLSDLIETHAGQPLSMRGILALAEARSSGEAAPPTTRAPAPAR